MPITYGSVCSGIEAATQAWQPLGMRAAWLGGSSHHFAIASCLQEGEHSESDECCCPQGRIFENPGGKKRKARASSSTV